MRINTAVRILGVVAVLLSSLALTVKPAGAAPVIPQELQDPQVVCEELFGGIWADGDCYLDRDHYFFVMDHINQGFYGGGFNQYFTEFLAEFGCDSDEGIYFAMIKIIVGPGEEDYIYTLDPSQSRCGEPPAGSSVGGRAGGTDDAGTLSLKQPRNGFIQYDAGTCSGVCKVSGDLPVNADKYIDEIPGTVSATLYVQLGGGTGSYSACFWGEGQIYQRISGVWQAVATNIGGGMSCAAGAGDGTFAFVEN